MVGGRGNDRFFISECEGASGPPSRDDARSPGDVKAALKFSVVIPLHDKAAHVERAIESVLRQDYAPFEIIVIDDASTDGGGALVAPYAAKGVTLLRRDSAGPGGYAARNFGIDHATGDWIAFLDADDSWTDDHLATLAELARTYPSARALATRYDHVFESARTPDRVPAFLENGSHLLGFADFLKAWLQTGHCPLWTGAVAIDRRLLTDSERFPEGRAMRGGDKDLWLRVANHSPIAFSAARTAAFYRFADNKVTVRTGTRDLPCLVPTAHKLAENAGPTERALLRRLINQEIGLYARWSAGCGERPRLRFRDFAFPPDPASMLALLYARAMPKALLDVPHRLARLVRHHLTGPTA